MFRCALKASKHGDRGVIGSTQNILDFINRKVREASANGLKDRLQFVLGTEVGMVTSIVNSVQETLKRGRHDGLEVEIVFPVNSQAIVSNFQNESATTVKIPEGLSILPGAASGEGCTLEGGCASCPYMKMNSLEALLCILRMVESDPENPLLDDFAPKMDSDGATCAEVGSIPILNMRYMQKHGKLSSELVNSLCNIESRTQIL